MTGLVADVAIVCLLVLSVLFGGIGVSGLLLFPDTRSRMYTATRAPLIGAGAMVLAVIFYAVSMIFSGGGEVYVTLVLHTLVLFLIIAMAQALIERAVMSRVRRGGCGEGGQQDAIRQG